jgi:arylsulfatase A-like enzyme
MDGRSLVPLLRGSDASWPKDRPLGVEYTGRSTGFSSCSYRGIRTGGQIYVEHTMTPDLTTGLCEPRLEIEHYDLRADPFQLENLSGQDQPVTDPLRHRLALLRDCSGIEGRDPAPADASHCE